MSDQPKQLHATLNGRARRGLIAPSATPEEAAAIVAALERFMRATAQPAPAAPAPDDGWRRAAMREAVAREPEEFAREPWINT